MRSNSPRAAAARVGDGPRASPGARSVSQHPHEPYSVMTQSMALIPQRSLERMLPTEGPRYGIAMLCPASALALPRFRRSGSSLPRVSPGLGARKFEREKAHRTVVRQGRCQHVSSGHKLYAEPRFKAAGNNTVQAVCPSCFNTASNRALTSARILGRGWSKWADWADRVRGRMQLLGKYLYQCRKITDACSSPRGSWT
jgi:hypothetical protein